MLAKPPAEIQIKDIFYTLEGPVTAAECLEHAEFCPRCTDCATRQIWGEIQDAILGVLQLRTLQDLVDQSVQAKEAKNYQI